MFSMDKGLYDILKDKKVFLFDCDGTIADTDKLNYLAFKCIYETLTNEIFQMEDHMNILGKTAKECFDYFILKSKKDIPVLEFKDIFVSAFGKVVQKSDLKCFEYVYGIFNKFPNTKKYILSNQVIDNIQAILKKCGLENCFTDIISTAEIEANKEDIYANTIKYFGVTPEDIVIFEDNKRYIDIAKNSGMSTVGIENDYNKGNINADYKINVRK